MKLNIQERLVLVNLVPEKGNFETMSIVEDLRKLLYPTETEVKKFEIKQSENSIQWNIEGAKQIEINITDGQLNVLEEVFKTLDEKKELTFDQYSLFKKIKGIEKEKEK